MRKVSSRCLVFAVALAVLAALTAWSRPAHAIEYAKWDPFGDDPSFAYLASVDNSIYIIWSRPATGWCIMDKVKDGNQLDGNLYIDLMGGDDTFFSVRSTIPFFGCAGTVPYLSPIDTDWSAVWVFGSAGDDDIEHSTSRGRVYGGPGNDWIRLTGGSMFADGETGNDTLIVDSGGGPGADIRGGDGDDVLYDAGNLASIIICGAGVDSYYHTGSAYIDGCENYSP
jgi:hypothetical protein